MYLQTSIFLAFTATALADVYTLSSTIPWAPQTPSSVDQSLIYNSTYYLADRSNRGIHVISLTSNTQTTLISGFLTTTVNGSISSATSGPDGIIILPNRNELYAGDGDGTVKVIDLFTNKIVANITTGSKKRADEFAYDPTTGTVIVTNPNESPNPFVTVINASTRAVLGKVVFTGASGLEQPRFNTATKTFYVSVPDIPGAEGGAVVTIDVSKFTMSKIIPTPECENAGIVFGANNSLFVSCSATQLTTYGFSASYIIDATTGALLHNITGLNGVDQVAYSSKTGWFYASAYQYVEKGAPSPFIAVLAQNGTIIQKIPTDNSTAHAVAVDDTTGSFVVPVKAKGVLVYSLGGSGSASSTASSTGRAASASATASGAQTERVVSSLVLGGVLVASALFAWAI
jgi:hypothetical protein